MAHQSGGQLRRVEEVEAIGAVQPVRAGGVQLHVAFALIAVIAGSAVNHDGRSNGMLAPNPDAQEAVLRKAYKDAGINPRDVDYIEAHGTGTILGDPIEADALGRVVGRGRADDKPALLGAVKSNVGHLESAAGAASLAKMALSLQHDKLPPSINYAGPNPYIDFDKEHLKVNDTVSDWPRYSGQAIAGVSGFGFGGANAHLVLREVLASDLVEPEPENPVAEDESSAAPDEADQLNLSGRRMDEYGEFVEDEPEYPSYDDDNYELPGLTEEAQRLIEEGRAALAAAEPARPVVPLFVSGFLTSRKRSTAAELADWIDSEAGRASSLESIGRSLSRRNHGRSRAVVLAHDHDEAVKGLRALADGKQSPLVLAADGPVTNGPVWVFAGFGAQHRKMGKDLYLRDEVFAEWINKVDALIQDERGYSIVELILDDAIDYTAETCEYPIEVVQTVIFALQIGLGELLRHHGANPGAVVGQSLGEAAAAYFSGGLSLADATRTICSRAHLMGEGEAMLFGEYIRLMALVEYSAEEIKTVFADFPGLEVCVYAAPTQTVIGGPPEQVDAIIARASAAFHNFRDAQVFALVPPAIRGLGQANGFTMELQNTGGLDEQAFDAARDRLLAMATADPMLSGVRLSELPDIGTLRVHADPQKIAALGLTQGDVNTTLSTAWGGRYVNDFVDRGRVKRVYVQGDAPYRAAPDDIGRWFVRGSNGQDFVYEHVAPERFMPRSVRTEPLDGEGVLFGEVDPQPPRRSDDARRRGGEPIGDRQVPAVVAPEHDDRLVLLRRAVEGVEQPADQTRTGRSVRARPSAGINSRSNTENGVRSRRNQVSGFSSASITDRPKGSSKLMR